MTLKEFNQLSAERKREVVLFADVFLAARETAILTMLLYQVDGFYIEVFSCKKEQAIIKMRAFESTDQLEGYLQEVDITAMVAKGMQVLSFI